MKNKATRPQQKKFFALAAEGGWDKELLMKRAVALYKPDENSFANITGAQMKDLIDSMEAKISMKPTVRSNNALHVRMLDKAKGQVLYSHISKTGNDRGIIMYFPLGNLVDRQVTDENDHGLMLGSGKIDIKNNELFQEDIFMDEEKQRWSVDWDNEQLQWAAFNTATNEKRPLCKFGRVKLLGATFEERIGESFDE